jgi:hypothetical protein
MATVMDLMATDLMATAMVDLEAKKFESMEE